MPGAAEPTALLFCVLLAVIGLIVLIARFHLHAFLALTLASFFVGIAAGMAPGKVAQAFQEGMGAMLALVAPVVGLGMILGKLLEASGGAEVVARTLIRAFGQNRLDWTLALVGILVGIPVFFTVGVVLLAPILFTLLRETRRPLLSLGIPIVAGLSVMHGLAPPHPGPLAAVGLLKADTGKTILFALLVGIPTAALAGPVFATFLCRAGRLNSGPVPPLAPSDPASARSSSQPRSRPGFGTTLLTILLPIGLMLIGTVGELVFARGGSAHSWTAFVGHPITAMLLATLVAFYTFGVKCGFSRREIQELAEKCLFPAGAILLVVGAGGGFNRVLIGSGVGDAVAALARSSHLSPLLLGWLVAAGIRIATGSATVAITTAAGIVGPFASQTGANPELLVLATGAGSLTLSHVNDGGFWFVKEYFGLSVQETFRSWTVMETLISAVSLIFVLLLNAVL